MNQLNEALLSDIETNYVSTSSLSSNGRRKHMNNSMAEKIHSPLSLENGNEFDRHDSNDNFIPSNTSDFWSGERFVSIVFWLLGVGVLLPWNAFTSAAPYFESRFCASNSRVVRESFEAIFGLIFTLSSVTSLIVMLVAKLRNKSNYCKENQCDEDYQNSLAMEGGNFRDDTRNEGCSNVERSNVKVHSFEKLLKELSNWSNLDLLFDKEKDDSILLNECKYEAVEQINKSHSRNQTLTLVPMLLSTLTFIVSTIFIFVTSINVDAFFMMTITCLIICGACQSIASAMFVGLASIFPSGIALNPFFSGQGLGAILVVTINLFLAASDNEIGVRNFHAEYCPSYVGDLNFDQDQGNMDRCPTYTPNLEAFFYFLFAIIMLIACIIGYIILERLPITKFYKESAKYTDSGDEISITQNVNEYDAVINPTQECANIVLQEEIQSMELDDSMKDILSEGDIQQNFVTSSNYQSYQPFDQQKARTTNQSSEMIRVWKVIFLPSLSIFLTLMVSVSIFPAWDVKLASVRQCVDSNRLYNDLFFPMTFVVYHVFDLIGRLIAGYVTTNKDPLETSKQLLFASIMRFLFIPLFLFCPANESIVPNIFESDVITFFLLAILALTNGINMTTSFTVASDMVGPGIEGKYTTSIIMSLCLRLGLLFGSFLSFIILRIGTGHW